MSMFPEQTPTSVLLPQPRVFSRRGCGRPNSSTRPSSSDPASANPLPEDNPLDTRRSAHRSWRRTRPQAEVDEIKLALQAERARRTGNGSCATGAGAAAGDGRGVAPGAEAVPAARAR